MLLVGQQEGRPASNNFCFKAPFKVANLSVWGIAENTLWATQPAYFKFPPVLRGC